MIHRFSKRLYCHPCGELENGNKKHEGSLKMTRSSSSNKVDNALLKSIDNKLNLIMQHLGISEEEEQIDCSPAPEYTGKMKRIALKWHDESSVRDTILQEDHPWFNRIAEDGVVYLTAEDRAK